MCETKRSRFAALGVAIDTMHDVERDPTTRPLVFREVTAAYLRCVEIIEREEQAAGE